MDFRYLFAALMMLGCLAAPAMAQQEEREFIDGRWVKTADPTAHTPTGELAHIRLCVANQEGSEALELAKSFLAKYPDEPGREEAMYLAGQAEMIRGMYYQAFERFKQQWDEFPSGQFSEKALQRELEIANAFLAGKKRVFAKIFYLPARSEGQEILTRIAEQAPGSTIAETALLRIAEDHVAHQEYVDAAKAYDRCYELFPKSVKAKEVMLQAARATHASFKGTQFDPTPLIEAEQRFKQYQNDYPQTAVKVGVPETLKQIERQKAAEEFASAQLYERTGHPQAAAFYYRLVRDKYPLTDLAETSKAALTRIGDVTPPKAPVGMASSRPAASAPFGLASTTAPATIPAAPPSAMLEPATKNHVDIEPLDLEKMVSAAVAAPTSRPASMPVNMPTTEAAMEVATEPATEPASEPATQPAGEADSQPAKASTTEPASEPASEPATEATTEPASEPATKAASQPGVYTIQGRTIHAKPMTETEIKSVIDAIDFESRIGDGRIGEKTTSQPAPEPASEPATQPATEPASQDTMQQDKASE